MSVTQPINLDAMATARNRVFETEELFEGILSFLPFKDLFYIRRVSKRWAGGIDGSASLQQKMFLRHRDQSQLWILDRKHKVGANQYRKKYAHLNDTEMNFQRVKVPREDSKSITPVTLNPMLQNDNIHPHGPNVLRMAIGHEFEEVTYRGRTDAFWDNGNSDASFWDTFVTGPPCDKIAVKLFSLYFGNGHPPPTEQSTRRPIQTGVAFSNFAIEVDTGVRMRDILLAGLTAHGDVRGWFAMPLAWRRCGGTILDAVEAAKKDFGNEYVSERPRIYLKLLLIRVGSAQPLLATDEERADANLAWN